MTRHVRGCRAADLGPAFCSCPEPAIEWDPDRPRYELWLDGFRLVTMQDPARMRRAFNATTGPESVKRYGHRQVAVKIIEGRRHTDPGPTS